MVLDDEVSAPGHMRALTWSPDGEWLAFTNDNSGYLVRLDGTGLRRVVSGNFASASVQWSPDGSRLAYLRTGQSAYPGRGRTRISPVQREPFSIVNVDGSYEQAIEGLATPENASIA